MDKQDFLLFTPDNSQPAVKDRLPDIIIIFLHYASLINFPLSMKKHIYDITDERLYDPNEWLKKDTFPKMFYENMERAVKTKKKIILLSYNPAVAFYTKDLIDMVESHTNERILCLSFFHDDKETNLYHIKGIRNMLDFKFTIIKSMLSYHFIKKITVPFNYKINMKNLTSLINGIA